MAHRKIKNYQGSYQQYSNRFLAAKNKGLKKPFAKKFTKKEFDMLVDNGYTIDQMLEKQTRSRDVAERAWHTYEELRDKAKMQSGNYWESQKRWENSFFGSDVLENEETGILKVKYHRTMSGFLKDKYVIHFLITEEILQGRPREEVLDDYGYHD